MAQGTWQVGTATDVTDQLLSPQEEFDIENLTIFPHLLGMNRPEVVDQLDRLASGAPPASRRGAVAIESA